jgi:hypothetical protein
LALVALGDFAVISALVAKALGAAILFGAATDKAGAFFAVTGFLVFVALVWPTLFEEAGAALGEAT